MTRTGKRPSWRLIAALGLVAFIFPATSLPQAGARDEKADGGSTRDVVIKQFRFQPPVLEVPAGTTVRWENQDDILHVLQSGTPEEPADEPLKADLDGRGARHEHRFDEPGEYPYFCGRHHSMQGKIVVTRR